MNDTMRFSAVLPGRAEVVYVCHDKPAQCAACLRRIAEFLAFEMNFNFDAAQMRSHEVYRAELGEDRCTEEQARLLRLLTCQRCLPADLRGADLSRYTVEDAEAKFLPAVPSPVNHGRVTAIFVTFLLCVAVLALIAASAALKGVR